MATPIVPDTSEHSLLTANNGFSYWPLFFVFPVITALSADRLVKILYQRMLSWRISINQGLSFSIPASPSVITLILIAATVVVIGFVYYFHQHHNSRGLVSVGCIVGGAMSNVYDRVRFGGVLDVFHVAISYFNLADIIIIAGIIGVIISLKDPYHTTAK